MNIKLKLDTSTRWLNKNARKYVRHYKKNYTGSLEKELDNKFLYEFLLNLASSEARAISDEDLKKEKNKKCKTYNYIISDFNKIEVIYSPIDLKNKTSLRGEDAYRKFDCFVRQKKQSPLTKKIENILLKCGIKKIKRKARNEDQCPYNKKMPNIKNEIRRFRNSFNKSCKISSHYLELDVNYDVKSGIFSVTSVKKI